jgi:hypothetical protein
VDDGAECGTFHFSVAMQSVLRKIYLNFPHLVIILYGFSFYFEKSLEEK